MQPLVIFFTYVKIDYVYLNKDLCVCLQICHSELVSESQKNKSVLRELFLDPETTCLPVGRAQDDKRVITLTIQLFVFSIE